MKRDQISGLTDAEREVLRLVYIHNSDKIIAPILGITPESVKRRVNRALQKLGVRNRHAAARLLLAAEGAALSPNGDNDDGDDSVSPFGTLADPPNSGSLEEPAAGDCAGPELREERVAFTGEVVRQARSIGWLSALRAGLDRMDGEVRLPSGQRLWLITKIGLGWVLMLVGLGVAMSLFTLIIRLILRQPS